MKKILLCLALTGCSTTQLHTASNGLLVADWAQTRYVAAHPEKYRETNPTLGTHPSTRVVNTSFAAVLLLNNTVYYLLPENNQRTWSIVLTGFEGARVTHNATIGVKFKW